MTSAYLLEGQQ